MISTIFVLSQITILIGTSAACSGLNISLMSLNISDLKRKAKMGNNHAKKVLPFRQNSHLTLASILFSNVGVNTATAIVLSQHWNGFVAGVISTLLIVSFGEVLPQALFARHALLVTSRFAFLLKVMIFVTYPVSKPIQLLLDKAFGDEHINLHSRRELSIMINEHIGDNASELDDDEVEIMRSALTLSERTVSEIMTPIKHVYWLTPNTLIDGAMIEEIKAKSWSRMPVFNSKVTVFHGILLMKDLVDIDFDETPILVKDMTLYPVRTVGSKTALDTMFRKFITARTHLIPITKSKRIVGIVTIEDLIEQILGHEIQDESDHIKQVI